MRYPHEKNTFICPDNMPAGGQLSRGVDVNKP